MQQNKSWMEETKKKKNAKTKIMKRMSSSWSVGKKEDSGYIKIKQNQPLTQEETIGLFHINKTDWQPFFLCSTGCFDIL